MILTWKVIVMRIILCIVYVYTNARQLGPWTTRTETTRTISEDNSDRIIDI